MTEFRDMWDAVIADITPQPWDYTSATGTTLTVIPEGSPAAPGDAEVLLIITADKVLSARVGITTTDLPGLVTALTERRPWDITTLLDGVVTVTYPGSDGVLLLVTETTWDDERRPSETTVSIRLPEKQRLPLAAALRRTRDVALGWED